MVSAENISFVVQGPVFNKIETADQSFSTKDVLTSIRNNFPAAEIILSTWEGTDIRGLDYDKVVYS